MLSQHFSAGGGPFRGYYRSCYQTNTNKTLLARLQRDESKAESENNERDASPTCDDRSLGSNDADPHPITIRRRSGVPSTDLKKCIICPGEKTKAGDRRRGECLTQCMTLQASEKLLNAARTRRDDRILIACE